jgi:16S rRNA (guanine966-N2)-methyltransferase
MRVIAGALGGRRLLAPRGAGTRPTADRVREALFSVLGDVGGALVLDLFAGSGALGIEALSRGAAFATFVEREPGALAALEQNLASLELADCVRVVHADARAALRAARTRGDKYDLVFIDPPYAQASDLAAMLAAGLDGLLARGARVVSESARRTPLELGLELTFERRYGDTLIRIHEPSAL